MVKLKSKVPFYVLVLIIASLLLYWLGSKIGTEGIIEFIQGTGIWAPLIFTILTLLTYVIAPLSGTPLFLAGFLLFGKWFQIYTYFAFLGAVAINFWIARKWGRGLVGRLVGGGNMERVDQFTQSCGIKSLIFLRIFQGQFHDFISYAYGLTNIRFLPYFVLSALAPIPWLLVWQIYLFPRIQNFSEFIIWSVVGVIPLFIISVFFVAKLKKGSKEPDT